MATHSFSAVIWNVVWFVSYSGLRSWMGYSVLTGKLQVSPSIAHSSSLVL